ncbi:MAG: hypothetical protein ACI4RJ_02740 [Alphaproteobacteria bacterium]
MKKTLLILSLVLCFAISAKADDTATSSLSDSEWCPNGIVEKGTHPTKKVLSKHCLYELVHSFVMVSSTGNAPCEYK